MAANPLRMEFTSTCLTMRRARCSSHCPVGMGWRKALPHGQFTWLQYPATAGAETWWCTNCLPPLYQPTSVCLSLLLAPIRQWEVFIALVLQIKTFKSCKKSLGAPIPFFSDISLSVNFFLFFYPSSDSNLQKVSPSMNFTTQNNMLLYILILSKFMQKVLLTSYVTVKAYHTVSEYATVSLKSLTIHF